MAKRKALDFTSQYEIHIIQSSANRGKFWSQIIYSEREKPTMEWEQPDLSESREAALAKAEDELDRRTDAWMDEVPE